MDSKATVIFLGESDDERKEFKGVDGARGCVRDGVACCLWR